ncbi:hypothetical protein RND71_042491 [Anisodus tanguticus]|nr:hypothetical protein RND71_042491 [Anisodus tanguticus]
MNSTPDAHEQYDSTLNSTRKYCEQYAIVPSTVRDSTVNIRRRRTNNTFEPVNSIGNMDFRRQTGSIQLELVPPVAPIQCKSYPKNSCRPEKGNKWTSFPGPNRKVKTLNTLKTKFLFKSYSFLLAKTSWKAQMGKGTGSFGKRRNKTHTLCVRCGRRSFHIQKSRCSACAYPAARLRKYNWSVKALRRKTTGTGRMRYLRNVPRRFKTNFREGTEAAPRKKGTAAAS